MVGLFHANTLLMPCQIGNQIFWIKWRFQPVKIGGRVGGKEWGRPKGASEKKKKKSPWEKWETVVPLGCIMVTFFIFTSDYNLSTKWLLHWIWIHVNFWHRLCVTSSRRYKFDFPPSLVYTFYCHTKKFAFLLPVAAYAFFFLTNVQNLYPDLHVKTQPKQQKRTSWAHTSYFYDGF